MTALSSIAAVESRISSIRSRLGIAPTPPMGAGNTNLGTRATTGANATFRANSTTPTALRTGSASTGVADFGAVSREVALTTLGGTGAVGGVDNVSDAVPFAALFNEAGARYGISPKVLAGIGYVESRFDNTVKSSAGAVGMMQFLPATAASMGVDPYNPASAIDGTARYLRSGIDRFGSLDMAIGAYNVGSGAMARMGSVQSGTQAERYVNAVIDAAGRLS